MRNLKDMVKDNKMIVFHHYCQGNLWYECEDHFLFAVPIKSLDDACVYREERAITMMRYIKRQLLLNEEGQRETT